MANPWQQDELLLTQHLYCRTPFGQLHQTNPDIIKLAHIIGRTPLAVAMKACNFASLDPALAQKGLAGASKADRAAPTNGIALNALYDKTFDRHLISFDGDFRLVLSDKVKAQAKDEVVKEYFLKFQRKVLEMPYRFFPDVGAFNRHWEKTDMC